MDCSREITVLLGRAAALPPELRQHIERTCHFPNNVDFLKALSGAALIPSLTTTIFTSVECLAVELCARWTSGSPLLSLPAFGRIVASLPYLSEIVQVAFASIMSGERHQDIVEGIGREIMDATGRVLQELLLGLLRLIQFDGKVFTSLIKLATLHKLLEHPDKVTRYLVVRVMCLYMSASDTVTQEMITKHIGTESIHGGWEDKDEIDYRFLDLWEEKRLKDLKEQLRTSHAAALSESLETPRIITEKDLTSRTAAVAGVLLNRAEQDDVSAHPAVRLVNTPTTTANLRSMANAMQRPEPILITGLAGSGKTTLVRHLAQRLGKSDKMVTLHLNEQSDAKLLIGIYTTGTQPGSFEWQAGVLTTAVKEGRWVFIEDLDRAPNEVISTLLPLIERHELIIPSRGEKLRAAEGFKIIATMRTSVNLQGEEVAPYARLLGSRLWQKVPLSSPTIDELRSIIDDTYPSLSSFMERIMAAYSRLHFELSRGQAARSSSARTRTISARELFKWCSRMNELLTAESARSGVTTISETALDGMFLDAVDCFTGSLEDGADREFLIACIAEEWHVSPQRKVHLLQDRTVPVKRVKLNGNEGFAIGRAKLAGSATRHKAAVMAGRSTSAPYAITAHSSRLLEQVAVAVQRGEPMLLVGETGIGKTTAVQHLAQMLGQQLVAINLSQQSESGDLLGGFKPVTTRSIVIPLQDEFIALFEDSFAQKKNQRFTEMLSKSIAKSQWKRTITLWKEALKMVEKALLAVKTIDQTDASVEQPAKRRKVTSTPDPSLWKSFADRVHSLESRFAGSAEVFTFSFTEGKLVKAVREGSWVLLDEINLASPDTLECLSDLLDSGPNARPYIMLSETGQVERIEAHPDFRIFAAMNPATDVGKKDLPMGIRSRFTEIYVNSPDRDAQSLQVLIKAYLERSAVLSGPDRNMAVTITELYQDIQKLVAEEGLVDGTGQRPHYSLRTLTRALSHASTTAAQCGLRRALYEGISMCFFTALDVDSEERLQQLVKSKLFANASSAKAELARSLREPEDGKQHVATLLSVQSMEKTKKSKEERHWMAKGPNTPEDVPEYIITPYIARNLRNVMRAASAGKHPILIQGPTSAGKTSMIEYLARRTGNVFVRINNHEHTDLQEYLGSYMSTSDGQLVFQEGVLVQAVRAGHWVVLDELNLAPTDVLEALNRLLDDNRELLIPETQEVVRPHPDFMLFATQNPAGPYGGRKMLSRAFRNRFLELHFDDIPVQELNIILARRSKLPESWCGLIVDVYKSLSILRQEQRLFEQSSFATLRDLFRWSFRGANSVEELAYNGYMLLAEKVRKQEERDMIKRTIEKVMSRKGVKVAINEDLLYNASRCPEIGLYDEHADNGIVWTKAMRRLYVLVSTAIRHNEAILLVGETGCGKTTVCQMLAKALKQQLHIVNAHQNTETGDLIGAQRPIRNRAGIIESLLADLAAASQLLGSSKNEPQIDLEALLAKHDDAVKNSSEVLPAELSERITANRAKRKALFEWSDGSLIQAMRQGTFYLLDEISLADDSVLERMNSVLDPQRSILLAEKGTADSLVTAQPGFQFFATMNPGGDFGKKELSPALRNRFTEIWVPPLSDVDDVLHIVRGKLQDDTSSTARVIVDFAKWFNDRYTNLKASTISIRDILAFVSFLNLQGADVLRAVVHGAAMVYIDTLGANPAALLAVTGKGIEQERSACLEKLSELLGQDIMPMYREDITFQNTDTAIGLGSFRIVRRGPPTDDLSFNFQAPTTKLNTMRVLRALQVTKPILLEGNPGVGKTSIVIAIAKAVGVPLTRINLSEQTDLMDLFGSDMPVDGAEAGHFAWRDAPFLSAMKRGDWVLLDEMNLASQSVLEGLNACLDHRGEVYIAELDQTFHRHPNFRLFAAQNPHHQGGGRKGLPASFVNRFTVVYADVFKQEDLQLICAQLYPSADTQLITQLVSFMQELDHNVTIEQNFGTRGAPWEFNLRDVLRWLHLCTSTQSILPAGTVQDFLRNLFAQRFRVEIDQQAVQDLFTKHFDVMAHRDCYANLTSSTLQVGLGLASRNQFLQSIDALRAVDLHGRLDLMETLLISIQQQWPVILVGASGSGKTYLLKSLASLVGVDLEVFPMNADIDAMDLVGGFEQADVSRRLQAFAGALHRTVRCELAMLLGSNTPASPSRLTLLVGLSEELRDTASDELDLPHIQTQLATLQEEEHSSDIPHLLRECNTLANMPRGVDTAKFEWIDGILVRALEQGRWLVLDNANLCSSSVLDRLNSLLEPNGTLIINEHPAEDGMPRIIKPHQNFRIFMTLDPQYGEVSRAMRNRAVEIFVPPISHQVTPRAVTLRLNSALQNFHTVLDVCSSLSSTSTSVDDVLRRSMTMLSHKDLAMLPSFGQQLQQGLIEVQVYDVLDKVIRQSKVAEELHTSWQLVSRSYYEGIREQLHESADFSTTQSIHTLSNQPLVAYNAKMSTSADPYACALMYETLDHLARMHLDLAQARTGHESTDLMTRLQRSFASARIPSAKRDSTFWVAPFLTNVVRALLDWVKSGSSQADVDKAMTIKLLSVITFWWNLFHLVSQSSLDEAVFQVYLNVGQRMLKGGSTESESSDQVMKHIAKQFEGFHAQTKMTSGLSMELIWNLCRPSVMPTMQRLEKLWQLEQIAEQFDAVVWLIKAPTAELSAVRTSIVEAIALARRQDVDVESLNKGFADVIATTTPEAELEERPGPFFQKAFEGLCQYLDLSSSTIVDSTLALLAGRTSKRDVSQTDLERLTSFSGNLAEATAMDGALPRIMLRSFATSSEVFLKHHVLLGAELEQLGRTIATNTRELCRDQVPVVWQALQPLVESVLLVHEDIFVVDGITAGIGKLHSATFDPWWKVAPEQPVRRVLEQYLLPLVRTSSDRVATVRNTTSDDANAVIKAAIALIMLYVPDRPYDPSLPAQVQRQFYDAQLETLKKKLNGLTHLAQLTMAQSTSLRSRLVQEEILALGTAPAITVVARPAKSQLELLQADFTTILNLVQRISRDLTEDAMNAERASEYIESVLAILKRLHSGDKAYDDIVRPVVGFVSILKLGLVLMTRVHTSGTSDAQKKVQSVLTHTPFIHEDPITYAQKAPTLELHRDAELVLHDLELLALRASLTNPGHWTKDAQSNLTTFFSILFSVWELQLSKEQRDAAAATSLYEHKGSYDDEEEANEEELRSLFPSYDEDDGDEEAVVKVERALNLQSVTPRIARLHMQIFQPDGTEAPSVTTLLHSAADILGKVTGGGSAFESTPVQQFLPAILLKVRQHQEIVAQDGTLPKHYNVYTDANIREAQRVIVLVEATRAVVRPILEAWPEHATLHNILSTCDELLAFRHVEPVMKFLTKVEKLHKQVAEWQTVASKEYSASTILDKTTDLLISWRQLELSTWARMLELETEKAAVNARSWYFLAYENVVQRTLTLDLTQEKMNEHATDLLASLEAFMSASTLGQYATKLKILASLQAQLKIVANDKQHLSVICSALRNFIYHYSRFVPAIEKSIDDGRKKLEKDIRNTIQLASWRDRNIEALKQSAKKSHSKLFRVIKKYRVLLNQPAGSIVAQGFSASLPDVVTRIEVRNADTVQLAPTAVAIIRQDSVMWDNRPERFRDVQSTVSLMQRKTTATDNTVDSSDHLMSFIQELEVSIEQLQKATPAILTEENTANVKHLTARKRKVFADVLKDLRTMGLKSNISVDVLATQASTAKVLSSVPVVSIEAGSRAQDLFSRALDAMPKVRTSHMEHNEDLTQAEVSRCIGYLESLLAILVKQRTSIERTSTWQQKLALQIAQVKNIWSEQGCTAVVSSSEVVANLEQVRVFTPWLSVIIRGGIAVLQAQATLGQIDLTEVIGALETHAARFEAYQSELATLPQLPHGLHTDTYADLQSRQRETIANLSQNIQEWSAKWPQTEAVLAHISKWTISSRTTVLARDEHESVHEASSNLVLAHYALLDQVLGSIQDVASAMHQLPTSAENPNWLLQEDRARQSILMAFHAETIAESLEAVLTSVAKSAATHGESDNKLSLVCGSLTMALPVLQQYHDTLSESLGQYLDIHTATSNLTYRLSRSFMRISSQGFCKPAQASEAQDGKTEKLESGTGLGEGEGAEDISNDIGDDEDLDDLAQDPENKKEDGAEIEKEDDAVSIQDELEGGAGESKGEQEEDDGKKDDKEKEEDADEEGSVGDGGDGGGQEEGEEGEDMDEDMGDVDDLGPSAVDEKMWGKAGDDSNKEQESKNQAGEVDKDEQAAGKEDQKKEEKQGEKGEQEEGEGQDDNEEDDEMSDDGSENGAAQDDIAMDPHVKEDEGLELPEELKLDGDKGEDQDIEEGMDEDMPDVDGSGEEDEDARPDELDDTKPTETDEQDDQAADQQNTDLEPNPEESAQDEDTDLANQMVDNAEAGDDQDMADQDSQARGGQANQNNADQLEQEATEADARAEEVEDSQQEQSASASAARRQTGEEKAGATDKSQAATADQAPPEDDGAPQESTDRQTVKKLGDILEKWHRQQKQIQEQSTERQDDMAPQDIDMADADFEHLPDEDAEADTQALGASSKEQARALNEEMAIETEDHAEDKDVETRLQNADEDEISADEDIDMDTTDPTAAASADTQAESQPRTFVGDRRDLNEPIDQPSPPAETENNPSDDLDTLEDDLDTLALLTRAPPSPSDLPVDPTALWTHHETRTLPLSLLLTEHLRLILAPTLATKLRGDFRTGKRLNIKRIIPYIASQYKRDKIWMRRSVPSKRAYQVLLAIDDSSSMAENGSKELAFDTLALVSKALTSLEVGEIGVVGFGEEVQVAHDFGMPLTGDAGAKVLARFGFKQERTNVRRLVERSIELFRDARLKASGSGGGADLWQLELIISDGICEDHEGIRRLLLHAQEERIMIVFVIVDAAADVSGAVQGQSGVKAKVKQAQSSIVDLEKVEFVQGAEGVPAKVVRTKYLDTFPFGYYLVVKDVRDLPGVLATALRQWFAEVAER